MMMSLEKKNMTVVRQQSDCDDCQNGTISRRSIRLCNRQDGDLGIVVDLFFRIKQSKDGGWLSQGSGS